MIEYTLTDKAHNALNGHTMPPYETTQLRICEDCMLCIEGYECCPTPECVHALTLDKLVAENPGSFINNSCRESSHAVPDDGTDKTECDESCHYGFSHYCCDICQTNLSGYRYAATMLTPTS